MSDSKAQREPYYGDLEKTKILDRLFRVPKDQRDESWKKDFLQHVSEASFASGEPQVIEGPDGFPYFQLNTPEAGKPFQCFVLKHMTSDFLLKEGFGVVINAAKGDPDWVFSYGDIVNYHIRKEFYTHSKEWNLPGNEVIQEEQEVLVGEPSENILPQETRGVVRQFLQRLGIVDCKITLMNRKMKDDSFLQEIVFNLTPQRFPKKEYYEAVMKSISWFLPRHYTYVSMDEPSLGNSFRPL